MAGKFYAVKKGKVPGIYTSWDACKSMVHGFPGAVYKGFATRAEAEQFLEEKKEEREKSREKLSLPEPYETKYREQYKGPVLWIWRISRDKGRTSRDQRKRQ